MSLSMNKINLYFYLLLSIISSAPANTMITDDNWEAINSSISGTVTTLAWCSENLYAGGNFTQIGSIATKGIAVRSGNSWAPVSGGITNGTIINVLAFDTSGNLYAGGDFYSIGNVISRYISKWNGRSWVKIDSGPTTPVRCIAFDSQNNVYAAGNINYSTMGSNCYYDFNLYIWKRDSSSWSIEQSWENLNRSVCQSYPNDYLKMCIDAISFNPEFIWGSVGNGSNVPGSFFTVNTIARDSGNLYVAGYSSQSMVSGSYRDSVECVRKIKNGAQTNILEIGFTHNSTKSFYTIAPDSNGRVFIGGNFSLTCSSGVIANNIVLWDGNTFYPLGSGTNGIVYSLAIDNMAHKLYLGGSFTTAGNKFSPGVAAVTLNDNNSSIYHPDNLPFIPIKCHALNSCLYLENIFPQDCISLYSITGSLLFKSVGKSKVPIHDISSQQLIVIVSRKNTIIFNTIFPSLQ